MKKILTLIIISLLCFSMFSLLVPRVQAQSGLVGYWRFDEGSGTTAADNSGNDNTGTLNNGPSWVDGRYGKALSFDGIDDYVSIPASSSLDVTSQVTVETWVYSRAYVDSAGTDSHIISRADIGGGHIYTLGTFSSGKVGFSVNPYPDVHPSTATLSLNIWTHLAMTYDGSYVRLYLNGEFDSSYALTGPIETTTNWFAIGCKPCGPWGGAGTYAYFDGIVDDVRIYNRALSQQEIQTDIGGQSFEISVSPYCLNMSRRQTPTFTVSLVSLGGFNSMISLSALIAPSSEYISLSFAPNSVTPPPDGSVQSVLTVSTSARAEYGFYTITIIAQGAGVLRARMVKLTIARYELFFEIDYMEGHRPTDSALSYIRSYFIQRGVALYFYVDDTVPSDPDVVTDDDFWAYEAAYNDLGDDKAGPGSWAIHYKWKWVLFGTALNDPILIKRYGLTFASTDNNDGGNYLFIADQKCDTYAAENSGKTTLEEVETMVLMHEIGHSIGILLRNSHTGQEIYDKDSQSVMTNAPDTYAFNTVIDERYSDKYWDTRNMAFYLI